MPFQKGHKRYPSSKPGAYASKSRGPLKKDYEPVDTVPDGLTWKAGTGGRAANNIITMYSAFGNEYRLVRVRATGETTYFKRKDATDKSPAEKIDSEPKKEGQDRYRIGTLCWLVEPGDRWFLCEVVDRIGEDRSTFGEPKRIVLRSLTGRDADRKADWPYPETIEIVAYASNSTFARLRPLKARSQ